MRAIGQPHLASEQWWFELADFLRGCFVRMRFWLYGNQAHLQLMASELDCSEAISAFAFVVVAAGAVEIRYS